MKITTISAAGVLSFDDFAISVEPSMTMIVGPNGAGKSNIVWLVELIVAALKAAELQEQAANVAVQAFLEARYRGLVNSPIRVSLGILLDSEAERALIRSFLQSAIYSAFISNSYGPESDQIARWVLDEITSDSGGPLWDGAIVASHPGTADGRWDVRYRFQSDGLAFDWLLGWGGFSSRIVRADTSLKQATPIESLVQRITGDSSTQPPRIPSGFFTLKGVLPVADSTVQCDAAPRGTPLPEPHRRFVEDMGLPASAVQNRSYTFGIVLLLLIQRAVVVSGDPSVTTGRSASTLTALLRPDGNDDITNTLFNLKNGRRPESDRYERIRGTFSVLTKGRQLNVGLLNVTPSDGGSRPEPGATVSPGVPVIRVSMDGTAAPYEIAIDFAGSGAWEALKLATTFDERGSSVVILDEPAVRLHPSLQRHLVSYFQHVQAQLIVITHSSYLLPLYPDSPTTQLVRIALDGDASRPWVVSHSQVRAIAPKLVAKGNERLPFADAAVLCEGQDDVAVVRIVAARLGLSLDLANVLVVDCGGRDNLPDYVRFCGYLGIPHLVVSDGDSRKALSSEIVKRQVEAVRQAVENAHLLGAHIEFEHDVETAFGLKEKNSARLASAAVTVPLVPNVDSEPGRLAGAITEMLNRVPSGRSSAQAPSDPV